MAAVLPLLATLGKLAQAQPTDSEALAAVSKDGVQEPQAAGREELDELRARVQQLEHEVRVMNGTVAKLLAMVPSPASSRTQPQDLDDEDMPDYYKLKEKAPEVRWLHPISWLYVSFDVYAGDRYLGEFRQSMPWVRLFWDEICFYDDKEAFHGQLYHGMTRWFLGIIPNPFFGEQRVFLRLADGSTPLRGAKESLLRAIISAEFRSLDFTWLTTMVKFKSRMIAVRAGQQEWDVQEAQGRGKAVEIKESVVPDVWGRKFRGWVVNVLPGKRKHIHPIVPGYLAAFDLAESEDKMPFWLWTFIAVAAAFGVYGQMR